MASQLKVDTLTGVTTAGSIVVTGEGNSTTTNLQQGLCKAWCYFNGSGTVAVNDSFNQASLTDNGTGNYTIAFTNSMGNTNYAVTYKGGTTFDAANATRETESPTLSTGSMDLYSGSTSTGFIDVANYHSHIQGDLA